MALIQQNIYSAPYGGSVWIIFRYAPESAPPDLSVVTSHNYQETVGYLVVIHFTPRPTEHSKLHWRGGGGCRIKSSYLTASHGENAVLVVFAAHFFQVKYSIY